MAEERKSGLASIPQFLREVQAEMKKVSWPQKHEVFTNTVVVGVAVVIVCALIWVCDLFFARFFHIILN